MQDDGGTANGGVDLDPSPNTITINVTPVNDAPAGSDATVTTAGGYGLHLRRGRLRLHRPQRQPGQRPAGGQDHDAARRGYADQLNGVAVTAGQARRRGDIAAGLLKFTPAANANGNNYATFTFQVQDNGGTANGGVDLDQSPNTITFNVTPRQRRPGGHGYNRSRRWKMTCLHLRRRRLRLHRPQRHPGQHPAGGQDHDAARRGLAEA